MTARVEFDGKQRKNSRYRRHDHDAGHDAPRARFLQPSAAEPPVPARESIFGKLLMRLFLIVGEEKRHRLVRRQFLRRHLRPLKRQRKGLLVPRLLILSLLVLRLLVLGLRLIVLWRVSQLGAQLLVSRLIGFIQPRIANGFVEAVERVV